MIIRMIIYYHIGTKKNRHARIVTTPVNTLVLSLYNPSNGSLGGHVSYLSTSLWVNKTKSYNISNISNIRIVVNNHIWIL